MQHKEKKEMEEYMNNFDAKMPLSTYTLSRLLLMYIILRAEIMQTNELEKYFSRSFYKRKITLKCRLRFIEHLLLYNNYYIIKINDTLFNQ